MFLAENCNTREITVFSLVLEMLNNPEYVNIHRQITLSEHTLVIRANTHYQCCYSAIHVTTVQVLCAMLVVAVVYTFTAIKVRHHVAMFCMKGRSTYYCCRYTTE